jgi:protein SCO1
LFQWDCGIKTLLSRREEKEGRWIGREPMVAAIGADEGNWRMKVHVGITLGTPAATSESNVNLTRRKATLFICTGLFAGLPAAPPQAQAKHSTEIAGTLPALDFAMTRASDGKEVGAADYRGKVILLYFGYTFCPDVCPTTLLNLTVVLKKLGPLADNVRVLFVTVDPNRDTADVLNQFTSSFAPQTVGLRGTADQLAALARRYRVAYSVEPATKDHAYEVTHGSGVYVFDRSGDVRFLFSGMATATSYLDEFAGDLRALIEQSSHPSLWQRILGLI